MLMVTKASLGSLSRTILQVVSPIPGVCSRRPSSLAMGRGMYTVESYSTVTSNELDLKSLH